MASTAPNTNQESSYRLVKLTAGKTAKIKLDIHGAPLPNVTWYKNSQILHAVDRYTISKEPNATFPDTACQYILKITKVRHSDEGLYTALAVNDEEGLTTNHIIDIKVKDQVWQDYFLTLPLKV